MSCVQNRRPDYWTTSGAVGNVLDLYFKHFKYSEKSVSLYSFFLLQEYESIIKGIIYGSSAFFVNSCVYKFKCIECLYYESVL